MQSRGQDKTCLNVGPRQSAQLCTLVCHRVQVYDTLVLPCDTSRPL